MSAEEDDENSIWVDGFSLVKGGVSEMVLLE